MKERTTILSKKDLCIEWFSGGPGAGGQHRNKHQNCCRIKHLESGAFSQGTEERNRNQNLRNAFKRLCDHPLMKIWISKKVYEIRKGESIEQTVDQLLATENLKIEGKNIDGQWEILKT